ncbi:hypothetical protein TIFTF001_015871 [Ficus carica]|uniref:Uncharacterized protein n=1 Tax=Ficus carica TaxID=3494 RepID=A0AA88AMC3_FICCA|nr:hypothetical protein TIFTF001_015871 [Ficus carica]
MPPIAHPIFADLRPLLQPSRRRLHRRRRRRHRVAKQLSSPSGLVEVTVVGSQRCNAIAVAKQPPWPSRHLQAKDRGSRRGLAVVKASATAAEISREASRGTRRRRKKEIHRRRRRNTTALSRDLDFVAVTLSDPSPA